MLAYYGTKLSAHMDKTPEGYLICRDVPIARTGTQEYLAGELGLEGDPERVITVRRHEGDVFEPAALASFEGKDVTRDHPPEQVGPVNHACYSKGHVQNVRRDGDKVVADLLLKDASLISDVEHGVIREVSCGYQCEYVPDGDGYRQKHIRGNHVAVVPRGRAGHEVAIKDQAARRAGKGRKYMGKFAEAILNALGMAAQEAKTAEEVQALVSTASAALDAAPEEKKPGDKLPEGDKPEEKPKEEDKPREADKPAEDGKGQAAPQEGGLDRKLDKILDRLDALERRGGGERKELHDEKTLDALVEKLTGKEAGVIPAGTASDSAVALLKAMRPAVAGIKDEQERSRVVDALIASVGGGDVMGRVMDAAAANARKAAGSARAAGFEVLCRESEAAYAARNPHKKKEE